MSFPETFTWIFDIWKSAIKYILEIRDTSGNLVCILENAHGIRYYEAINEAPTLRFSLPADDDKESNIIKANEIWLRNYESEDEPLIQMFRMTRRRDRRQVFGHLITIIEAEGMINQLADEVLVTEYSASSSTPETIVTALIALQVLSPAITVGTIAPTSTRTIKGQIGDTILKTIYRLRDTVGGYVYCDSSKALQWANSLGADTGQQVRYQKNMPGITRNIDYTTIGNRIYAFGSGSGNARVKLSDASGQANDYVEDATSQTTWAGIYVKVLINQSIDDPDTLLAWANLRLADLKNPIITYNIDTTDLAESVEGGFEFEVIALGSTINVYDADLGFDLDVHVVRIDHVDLLHPERVRMDVSNITTSSSTLLREKDIIDVITETDETQWDALIQPPAPTEYSSVVIIIDGGGVAIATGEKGHIPLPFAGEIISAALDADQSGSMVIDVWKDTRANFPPTDADSITASAPPTLSSEDNSEDTTLTGWTTTFSEGDILAFYVDSAATITRVTLALKVRRT